MRRMRGFFQRLASEASRRRVLRAMAIYSVIAWLTLQVAVVVAEPLGFPDWTVRVLILTAIVGFPVTFVLTWVIDLRPEGLIFDLPLLGDGGATSRKQKASDLALSFLTLVLTGAGSYFIVTLLVDNLNTSREQVAHAQSFSPAKNSIAVLAFDAIGGDEDIEYFAAGLAEELLNLLSGLDELKVAARTSSFQFRGRNVDAREVAQSLQVQNILEGSARQHSGRIRVTARLINGHSGLTDWSRTLQQSVDDIFEIQQVIARDVVDKLKVVLSIDSAKELGKQATESSTAYLDYLSGIGRLRSSLDADVMRAASRLFQQAIDVDPNFSKAYAGICEAHLRLYDIQRGAADFEVAKTACNRAAELNSDLIAEVQLALGKLYLYRGSYDQAEEKLNKAATLSADPIDAYIQLGALRAAQFRLQEAEAYLQKASDLNQNYWAVQEALASFYYRNGRYEDAAASYEKAAKLAPNVATIFSGRGAAYWVLGDFDKALESYQQSLEIKPTRQAYTNVGSLYYNKGAFAKAVENQLLALEFAPDNHMVLGKLAESFHFAGDTEQSKIHYSRAVTAAERNLTLKEDDWKTHGLLGNYYAMLGRKKQAIAAANRAVKLSRNGAEALYLLGLTQQLLGDSDSALGSLEAAVAADPNIRTLVDVEPFLEPLRNMP